MAKKKTIEVSGCPYANVCDYLFAIPGLSANDLMNYQGPCYSLTVNQEQVDCQIDLAGVVMTGGSFATEMKTPECVAALKGCSVPSSKKKK